MNERTEYKDAYTQEEYEAAKARMTDTIMSNWDMHIAYVKEKQAASKAARFFMRLKKRHQLKRRRFPLSRKP